MQIDVLCVCDSVVSCPLKHVRMCISWSIIWAAMDGWLSCHDSCSLSRCTFVTDSNHFVRKSSMYAGSKPHIVIITLSVLLFPPIYYHPSWLTRGGRSRQDKTTSPSGCTRSGLPQSPLQWLCSCSTRWREWKQLCPSWSMWVGRSSQWTTGRSCTGRQSWNGSPLERCWVHLTSWCRKHRTWRWEGDVHSAHWGLSSDLGTDALSPKWVFCEKPVMGWPLTVLFWMLSMVPILLLSLIV